MTPNSSATMTRWLRSPRFVAGLLFLVALGPRLPGLSTFLTSDENTNIFFAGSDVIAAFLRGDFRGTYWHFYPGVTMSWLDAMGLVGQYILESFDSHPTPAFTEYIYSDILSLVVASRVPYAILTALAVPLTYLLARRLLTDQVALLGALFMAFDPFYLAHSRVAHGDAPVAVFMSLSALTFFIYANRLANRQYQPSSNNPFSLIMNSIVRLLPSASYLLASAILGSLAALTKAPGQFMAIFIIIIAMLYADLALRHPSQKQQPQLTAILLRWMMVIAMWGLISFVAFIVLWPSMWVDPLGTFRQMWQETFGKVNEGHLVYFFGRPTLNPGPWFYFYVIPFRLTPIIYVGSLLSPLLFIPKISLAANRLRSYSSTWLSPLFFFWLFTIALLLFANLSPKKQDRYLLPLFPFLNLIAAIGWMGLINLITYTFSFKIPNLQSAISNLLPSLLLILHFSPTLTYYPYYLTYFNPLMGGPTRAAETTLMGWGEGMEQVAAYLNEKPNAADLYVASTPSQTLLPYFAGQGENFYTNDIAFRADYVVLYLAQMQRLAPSPEIVHYFEGQAPEKTFFIQGVPYAKVYPGPKLILPNIPPEATPINIGVADTLRLAGYRVQDTNVILYWHALAPLPKNYTISVRVRTATGDLLAQRDSWPVDGLLPTSQWRQGDYVVDKHILNLSKKALIEQDYLEVVVYDLETGETLGPPLILPRIEAR